jgi:hypothetical protein
LPGFPNTTDVFPATSFAMLNRHERQMNFSKRLTPASASHFVIPRVKPDDRIALLQELVGSLENWDDYLAQVALGFCHGMEHQACRRLDRMAAVLSL